MKALLLVTFSVLTLFNYWARRDVRYPPFLMSAVWFLVLILYYSAPIQVFPLGLSTAIIFIFTVTCFSGGGLFAWFWLAPRKPTKARRLELMNLPPAHPSVKKFLLALSVLLLPVMVAKAIWLAEQSGLESFFVGLRVETSLPDSVGYGSIGNASLLSYLTTFLYLVEYRGGVAEKWQLYFSLFISLIYAVLSTGRTPVLLILVGLIGISWIKDRFNAKKFIAAVLIFVVSFGAFALALAKGADPDASVLENVALMGESLLTYMIGGVPAFDSLVRENAPLEYGVTTFSAWINLIHRVTGHPLISPIQAEVAVPFSINVYTAIQPAYKDFGILGVIFAFTLIGAVSTYFYSKAIAGDRLHIFCYAVALFPLVLSAFTDQYFAPMVAWMKYFLAGYLYFRWGRTPVQSRDLTPLQTLLRG
jgi:oligosaccharide repeat unit polymerase